MHHRQWLISISQTACGTAGCIRADVIYTGATFLWFAGISLRRSGSMPTV